MKWTVLVREPPHTDAIDMLPKKDGKPEIVHQFNTDWYVFAVKTCALDVQQDIRLATDIGWGVIYVIPHA